MSSEDTKSNSRHFGYAVAIFWSGDKVAVGAPGYANINADSGAFTVFTNYVNNPWYEGDLTLGKSGVHLGWSVALSADGQTVVAGAPGNDDKGTDAGRVDIHVVILLFMPPIPEPETASGTALLYPPMGARLPWGQ